MKLYIFIDENEHVLEKIKARNIDEAVRLMRNEEAIRLEKELPYGCDFFCYEI